MADAHVTIQVTGAAANVAVNVRPASMQGPKGEPFRYEDFTPEQLEALRGPAGPAGETGPAGPAGEITAADKQEIVQAVIAEMPETDNVVSANGANPVSGAAVAAYVAEQIAAIVSFEGVAF